MTREAVAVVEVGGAVRLPWRRPASKLSVQWKNGRARVVVSVVVIVVRSYCIIALGLISRIHVVVSCMLCPREEADWKEASRAISKFNG